MRLDRADADVEALRDLLVRLAGAQLLEHLQLPIRNPESLEHIPGFDIPGRDTRRGFAGHTGRNGEGNRVVERHHRPLGDEIVHSTVQ